MGKPVYFKMIKQNNQSLYDSKDNLLFDVHTCLVTSTNLDCKVAINGNAWKVGEMSNMIPSPNDIIELYAQLTLPGENTTSDDYWVNIDSITWQEYRNRLIAGTNSFHVVRDTSITDPRHEDFRRIINGGMPIFPPKTMPTIKPLKFEEEELPENYTID